MLSRLAPADCTRAIAESAEGLPRRISRRISKYLLPEQTISYKRYTYKYSSTYFDFSVCGLLSAVRQAFNLPRIEQCTGRVPPTGNLLTFDTVLQHSTLPMYLNKPVIFDKNKQIELQNLRSLRCPISVSLGSYDMVLVSTDCGTDFFV